LQKVGGILLREQMRGRGGNCMEKIVVALVCAIFGAVLAGIIGAAVGFVGALILLGLFGE